MSLNYISTGELAKELGVPGSTIRRYIKLHGPYLELDKNSRNLKVSVQSIETLVQIREAYARGLSSKDVDLQLNSSGPSETAAGTAHPRDEHASGNVDQQLSALHQAISRLENLMAERFEQQGQVLNSLAEAAATIQLLNPEAQRGERVNARLNEWRVERKLESDALAKWAELPQSERVIRTGMFKSEENIEKRERFVREYVDKHFDDEMRNAYGV